MRLKRSVVFMILIPAVSMILSFESRAKEKYDLNDLMRAAVDNRSLIKGYETDVKKDREDLKILKGNDLPTLDAGYKVNQLNDHIGSESRENSALYARLTYNIFDGYLNKYEKLAAEKRIEADETRLESVKQNLMLAAAIHVLTVNRNLAYLDVTEEAVKFYREKYNEAVVKHKVGVYKKADLLKIKVELDNGEQEERIAAAEVNKSMNRLSQTCGMDLSVNDIDFCCFEELPQSPSLNTYTSALLKNRSELKLLSILQDAARYGVSARRSAFYPEVNASFGLNHYEDDYLPLIGETGIGEVRLTLEAKINLFDGRKKEAALRRQEYEIEDIDHDIDELKNALLLDLKNNHIDFIVAEQNVDTAKTGIEEAVENVRVTEYSYKKGIATTTDILDAVINLNRARFNVIDAKYQVFSNYMKLLRSVEFLGKDNQY